MYLSAARLDRYTATIRNTVRWVYQHLDRVWAEPDLQGHYKAPYFCAAVGDAALGGQYHAFLQEKFLRADGDYRTTETFKGYRDFPCSPPNQYIYPNGWITAGMQRLGGFDLVAAGLPFILSFQDPAHGGFYYTFDPVTGEIDRALLDSSSTSSAGLACLACGRLAEARRAGDFLLRLWALQPEPAQYFFSCMRPDGTLHTDVFHNEDKWAAEGRKQRCLSAEHDGMEELTWLIGKPTKFLARLYTATGERPYLDGAIKMFDFFHGLDDGAWTNYASCKTMWAGGELYRHTGDERFARTALRILDYFSASQLESGSWVHHLWYRDESEQPLAGTMDITYEFGGEITDVIFDLTAG